MATQGSELSQDVDALKEDIKRLRQDMAAVTDSLKKIVHEGAETGRARAQEELEHLYEQFKDTYESVRKGGTRVKTGLEKEIGDRPFTTVIGAFVVGMILGKLISSRSSH